MSENFQNKTLLAKKAIVFHFLKRVGLTHRVSTHVAQKDHHEMLQESLHFISMMHRKVAGMDPNDVLNMDQTQIPFITMQIAPWKTRNQDHPCLIIDHRH